MDSVLDYDKSRYNFTEETWFLILDYEIKLRGKKLFRKVNFKKGEMQNYISWIENIIDNSKIENVISNCIGYKEGKFLKKREFDAKFKLAYSFKKNKYYIPKIKKHGLNYSFENIAQFLAVLDEAYNSNCLVDFISIPDVWYILRNLRSNWIEFTGHILN